jgi:CRP-like cAMP-binding protein
MIRRKQSPDGEDNRLLAALPPEERERLLPGMETVPLSVKHSLYEPDQPIEHVYFVRTGVVSLVSVMEEGALVEVATIGNEGMVGLPVFLGADTISMKAFVQIPGEAWRMGAAPFREAVRNGGRFPELLQRYTQALFLQVAQGAACNRAHSIEERCARWLLMTHDRVERDEFPLTQEFLAIMLGVRRPSVTVAAGILQKAGFIRYSRGRITVVDREGLEAATWECYGMIRREYDRLFDG